MDTRQNKYSKEILITRVFLAATTIFTTLFFYQLVRNLIEGWGSIDKFNLGVIIVYILISIFIIYGNLIYHLTRLGFFTRLKKHKQAKLDELEKYFFEDNPPLVTYLIPSYKEEVKVIEQTLWSAALQKYPKKRIVLLIDNPPDSTNESDKLLLKKTRRLIEGIQITFSRMMKEAIAEVEVFRTNVDTNKFNYEIEMSRLEKLYSRVQTWFTGNILDFESHNHVDLFYLRNIYGRWLEEMKDEAAKYIPAMSGNKTQIDFLYRQYRKIIGVLDVELGSFERKQYKNMSHEPNKAMNINSYLNLIGNRIRIFKIGEDNYLEQTQDPSVETRIPDSKYVVTLDADSMPLSEYTIKLVYEMEKVENQKVAVIQTPYSAYPGAKTPVELIAGATTDIQYNIHQGFTYYNSTYWVGANAMLRKSALEDIKMYEIQKGKIAVKYVQDRTVIEDTESSIDLVEKGWRLLNFPERMAYSSTPPDFGSLIIQRERWANGGLIIFPKLIKYVLRKPFEWRRWVEFWVRSNYLVSIAAINIGTLMLLIYPFSDNLFTFWLPLASIPYYYLYTRDLKQLGYRISDILRVYAMNLILVPINIAGVLKSIEQGITGGKIPFKRTPKIGDRVAAEMKFVIFLFLLLIYMVWATLWDIYNAHWSHVVYSGLNGAMMFYAIKTFIGFREGWADIRAQLKFT